MNEIIQNRALRGFLTLFLGVMLALSVGLLMQSIYPAPPVEEYDWYSDSGANGYEAWQAKNPEPDGDEDDEDPAWVAWEAKQDTARQAATEAWELDNPERERAFITWAVVSFLVLFGIGSFFAVGATLWQQRLAVLSGGVFLAGVLVIADAAVLNFEGLVVLDVESAATVVVGWLLVPFALIATGALLAQGWWRYRAEGGSRDGQRFYSIIAAVAPVWLVGVAVNRTLDALGVSNKANIEMWYCIAFFVAAVILLTVGMLLSRELGLLGNILTLSAVIMAFASVIASLSLDSLGTTGAIALAATAVAMLVGHKAFSDRVERVESIAVQEGTLATTAHSAAGTVLVLYASGENPPSDAKLVEVELGNGVVYRGFAARRAVSSSSSQAPRR